jgi:hypothetical protein
LTSATNSHTPQKNKRNETKPIFFQWLDSP